MVFCKCIFVFLKEECLNTNLKTELQKKFLIKVEANNVTWRVWEVTKRRLKKIGTFCVVAACSQCIKDNTKHSRVLNTRKRKCWVKPWLAEKHGLVSKLLLHDKKEFRIFLRMNTETYEVSRFLLISTCATRCGRRGSLTGPKSGRKICAVILTLILK